MNGSASCCLVCSERLDAASFKAILGNLVPKMGAKWDFIGTQLRQDDLVRQLRSAPSTRGSELVQQIIEAWMGSNDKKVPVCCETIAQVLRSEAVKLGAVAKNCEEVRWPVSVYTQDIFYSWLNANLFKT